MTAIDVVRTGLLDTAALDALRTWADEVEAWPTGSHVWGHYAEHTANGPRICRTENVSACHAGVAALVAGPLRDCAADALGEPVTAFKDKVNYKQPGGAGFSPHQDKVAYPGVGRVMSILVAIDDCSVESGCLWIAGGVRRGAPRRRPRRRARRHRRHARLDGRRARRRATRCASTGSHRTTARRTVARTPRRVLVASYAPTSEHYTREHYYAQRSERMRAETERDGRFRISTLADFDGAEVATEVATDHCTH